ncbi:3896_t:CDS:2, partial [Dentiscutata heterogama]
QIQNTQKLHILPNINILKTSSILQDTNLMRNPYSSYNNNHAKRDFINIIEKVIKEKTLAIVSKHITSNMPVYQFVGLIELKDCSANKIIKKLNEFFKIKNLLVLILDHFGSDETSAIVFENRLKILVDLELI